MSRPPVPMASSQEAPLGYTQADLARGPARELGRCSSGVRPEATGEPGTPEEGGQAGLLTQMCWRSLLLTG